ncbi:hypothetical protein HYDPIDRAFT_88696 [Hydnomerulius pinastri MD-312]|nr:hypothetical protein HYDPIDRAFT_88696 [Hydnomerulius pinastri MD-312]
MVLTKLPTHSERQAYKESLVTMLNTAIKVELSTIPVVVVLQEMLHLSLSGNLLTSVHEGPGLYSPQFIPTFGEGATILYSKIPLRLEPCEKSNLQCFLSLEAPYEQPPKLTDKEESANIGFTFHNAEPLEGILDDYHSIGEFYAALEKKIVESALHIDFKNKDLQFSPQEFFNDLMVQVVDQESAHKALKTIIDQGEGSVGIEEAHYQMFLDLYKERETWKCHPVPYSPTTKLYESNEYVHELALASNAVYCYLLITIQKTWQAADLVLRRALIGNTHALMLDIMQPLADVMVNTKFNNGTAAPPFEFYPTKAAEDTTRTDVEKTDDAARELFQGMVEHLTKAIALAGEADKKILNLVLCNVNRGTWPVPA